MEYVSRVPRPPLDGLIDDLYYLEGTPPYARLTLPPAPGALLRVEIDVQPRWRGQKRWEYARRKRMVSGVAPGSATKAAERGLN